MKFPVIHIERPAGTVL